MKYWGVEVPPEEKVKVPVDYFKAHHITNVALGQGRKVKKVAVKVKCKYNDEQYVVATLSSETKPQTMLDLIFEADLVLSHTWKAGSVFFSGYVEEAPIKSEELQIVTGSDDEDADAFNFKAFGVKSMPGGHSFHMLAHLSNKKKEDLDMITRVRDWRRAEKKRMTLRLLVKNLSSVTSRATLKNYFSKFGAVKDVFLKSYEDGTYARCALVIMESLESVTKIKRQRHYIGNRFMEIEKYWGDDALKQGRYKLIITRLKNLGPQHTSNDIRRVANDLNKRLEDAFSELPFTSIRLRADDDGKYTGDAEVRFKEKFGVVDRVIQVLHCQVAWEDTDA